MKKKGGARSLTSSYNSPGRLDGHCASSYLLSSDGLPGAALCKASVLGVVEHSSATLQGAVDSPAAWFWGAFSGWLGACLPAQLPACLPTGCLLMDLRYLMCVCCAPRTHTRIHTPSPDVRARPGGAGRWEGSAWSFLS